MSLQSHRCDPVLRPVSTVRVRQFDEYIIHPGRQYVSQRFTHSGYNTPKSAFYTLGSANTTSETNQLHKILIKPFRYLMDILLKYRAGDNRYCDSPLESTTVCVNIGYA